MSFWVDLGFITEVHKYVNVIYVMDAHVLWNYSLFGLNTLRPWVRVPLSHVICLESLILASSVYPHHRWVVLSSKDMCPSKAHVPPSRQPYRFQGPWISKYHWHCFQCLLGSFTKSAFLKTDQAVAGECNLRRRDVDKTWKGCLKCAYNIRAKGPLDVQSRRVKRKVVSKRARVLGLGRFSLFCHVLMRIFSILFRIYSES